MVYIGELGVATHIGGHVLDLTFSNISFAMAEVLDSILHIDFGNGAFKVFSEWLEICRQTRWWHGRVLPRKGQRKLAQGQITS